MGPRLRNSHHSPVGSALRCFTASSDVISSREVNMEANAVSTRMPSLNSSPLVVELDCCRSRPLGPVTTRKVGDRQLQAPVHCKAIVESGWQRRLRVLERCCIVDAPARELTPQREELLVVGVIEAVDWLARQLGQ